MNLTPQRLTLALALLAVALFAAAVFAKEARPPKWSRDLLDTFFEDAREQLVGERPNYDRAAIATANNQEEESTAGSTIEFAWSKLISADTIETEIKRLSQSTAKSVANATEFKGGGYKHVRRQFSELALLFAVAAQYDGDVRWKKVAAGLRQEFSHAAVSANEGTDESRRAAIAGTQLLAELIRGEHPAESSATAAVSDWSEVSAREPLMQRLNIAHQERLNKWLADTNAFRTHQRDVAHEAQIVALLAEVIHRHAFEFSDDDTFVEYANSLQESATDISTAAQSGNFDRARSSMTRAIKACADCHDGYRG